MNRHFVWIFILVLIACQGKDKPQSKPKETGKSALFTLMHPDSTGLDYYNQLDENEKLNILTYEYLYNGGGIAVGDINNDGLPDVFMVGNTYGGRLFLNQGNLKFKQISNSAGIFVPGFSTGVSMVDINEDGFLDIYLCRSLTDNPEHRRNVLFINNGDLTFTDRAAEYDLDDPGFSIHANFFDYDNDGDLDLFLLNHRVDFKDALTIKTYTDKKGIVQRFQDTTLQYVSDKLYRNNGDHSFTDVTEEAGLSNRAFGLSATVADLNQDGWPDIFVANDYADKDHLYINQMDGTFMDQIDESFFHSSKNAMGSDIADFNNDGLLDLINLDMMAEDNYRQKQLKGAGAYDHYHMAVQYGLTHQIMRNTLQLNNGNGTFSEIAQLAGVSHTDWSWTPLFADFDNDGWKDLFISNGYYRDVTDMDYLKYESNEVLLDEGGVPNASPFALTKRIPQNSVVNYIYRNEGDLTFSNQTKAWGMDTAAISNGAVYADLDLDGDLDIICNNLNSKAFVFRNNANELNNNFLQLELKGNPANPKGVGTKVYVQTKEGEQMLVASPYRGFLSSVDPVLHFGLGKASVVQKVKVMWSNGFYQEFIDVSANQRLIINQKEATEGIPAAPYDKTSPALLHQVGFAASYQHQEDDFIDFKREPLLEHKLSNKGPFLAKGDVNADGLEDVYFTASAGFAGELHIQKANGTFEKSDVSIFTQDAAFEDGQAVFFDTDDDEDLDLYVVSGGSAFKPNDDRYQDRLYLNDGEGNFKRFTEALPDLKVNGTCVAAFDADGDDDLDLFVGGGVKPGSYPLCEQSQLLINDGGTFRLANELLPKEGSLGMVNAVDLIEGSLVLAGEWMPITLLKRVNDSFEMKEIPNSSGWWNCIELADFDGDGDMDFVAGNRGENNFYGASAEKPATIYAKDFDENGSMDAIPFYYFNDGKQHPKHTLDAIFAQYPAIRRKFPRYAKYSAAVLEDIFSLEQLEGSVQLLTHTFSTSYFENKGEGNYSMHTLPKEAQFSEVHGLLSTDLNDDGFLDLMVSGNNYGVDVESGRMDASIGAVLVGDGKGNFKAIPVNESGFEVLGDSRGIYNVQKGEDVQFWVLRNGDKLIDFDLTKHTP